MKGNLLNKGLTYFWQLFLIGGCFITANILLVFLLIFVEFSLAKSLLYVVPLLLIGPSFVPVISVTRKMVTNNDDLRVIKDYFNHYMKSFKQNVGLWCIYIITLSILIIDMYYVTQVKSIPLLMPLFILLLLLGVLSLCLTFGINSYFQIKSLMAIRLSFYLAFKQPMLALYIILSMFTLYIFFMLFPQIAIFFGIPLFSLNLVLLTRKTFSKLTLQFVE